MRFSLTAKGIVGERDSWSTIRVDCVSKVAPVVIGVVGDNAACPGTTREFAVGGVGVGWALAVGVDFVRH